VVLDAGFKRCCMKSGAHDGSETIACAKCKQLFDAVTSEDPGNPKARRVPLRCPRSRTVRHPVKAWKAGDSCPRCGGRMPKGQLLAMWD
jgi:hypothetical protein